VAPFRHPWVDDDVGPMEDAALLRPESGSPLVFTVDFITPIVDRPEDFGAVAAANSLSDVYAMGGAPQAALAICGFPEDKVSAEVVTRILTGGRDKAAEAGCVIAGGHTLLNPELTYGLCVIGTVAPDEVLGQSGAAVGDRLVLTKPLGTGILAQAIKQGRLGEADRAAVVTSMKTLNEGAKDAALAAGVRAATDVTGFGLLGHLHHLALASGCAARLFADAVPTFAAVRTTAEAELVPGGSKRNLQYVEPVTRFDPAIGDVERLVLADAQTSGGLLLAVAPEKQAALLAELARRETPERAVVGEIIPGEAGHIEVVSGGGEGR
jgi:selenide,water dikinase